MVVKDKIVLSKSEERILKVILYLCIGLVVVFLCYPTSAGELVHKWKSPSFSGIGFSAHALTIENQEFTRKAEIRAKKDKQIY